MKEPAAANTFAPKPKKIQTAACLIVGDEVLGGKTNSNYMAKLCFELGIDLRKVEVVPDDESEIIDAILRMSSKYDFVVTSGGIGPTHDDVTFPALAKAFGLKLELNQKAYGRMKRLMKPHPGEPPLNWDVDSVVRRANTRMVILPTDPSIPAEEQFLFNVDALWAPVTVANGNVYVLPGVPFLFEMQLQGLKGIMAPEGGSGLGKRYRVLISTPLSEASMSDYLTELAVRMEGEGIKVGVYERWGMSTNTVTLVGRDLEKIERFIPEVEKSLNGRRITKEED
ncbi:hypothetical protein V498_07586 [Pseudogymnoascus sp. VKM F-4517 (FW-2822)]|nr:hypothetical protein V498_07586 [Pseudogymnoascus sp. VKM F-4517 (FW-2822)]